MTFFGGFLVFKQLPLLHLSGNIEEIIYSVGLTIYFQLSLSTFDVLSYSSDVVVPIHVIAAKTACDLKRMSRD